MRKLLAGMALLASFAAHAQQSPLPPFQPVDTKSRAVTGTAANLTLPTALSGTGSVQYVLTSFCTASERIYFNSTTVATVSNSMPMLPNSQFVLTLPASITTLSVIGDGTSCTFYATVGVGQ